MDNEGNSLKFEDYLKFVKQFVITKEHFYDIRPQGESENKEWPNCVNKFLRNQVKEGEGRNDAMFNVGILAKKINLYI